MAALSAPEQGRRLATRILEEVVASIVRQIESGVAPWVAGWTNRPPTFPRNARTLSRYRAFNALLLWDAANRKGYSSDLWVTPEQFYIMGAWRKRGEEPTLALRWGSGPLGRPEDGTDERFGSAGGNRPRQPSGRSEGSSRADPSGSPRALRPFEPVPWTGPERSSTGQRWLEDGLPADLTVFELFNVQQLGGVPPLTPPRLPTGMLGDFSKADGLVGDSGAYIGFGAETPHYAPAHDQIGMPYAEQFEKAERYYSTLLHELAHWTGHPSRLQRLTEMNLLPFTFEYAEEELVAELGAAFLCVLLGVTGELRHAEYLDGWLRIVRLQPAFLFRSASDAEAIVQYLDDIAPGWITSYREIDPFDNF